MSERRVSTRVLSALLVLCMVFGMVPAGALRVSAADATTDTTKTSLSRIQAYASNLLNTNFSKAASDDEESTSDKFTWDTEGKKTNWRYFNGVMLDAFLMLGVNSEAGNALEFAKDFLDDQTVDADTAVPQYITNEVDSVPPALVLFDLLDTAEVSAEDRTIYAKAINYVYKQLSNQTSYADCGGNFLHKQQKNDDGDYVPTTSWDAYEIGLDGIYMAQPFMMAYANALAEGKITNTVNDNTASNIYKEVYDRLMWIADNMATEVTVNGEKVYLYNHGYDVTNDVVNGHYWGRGIGWYAAGLVMCIDMMPDGTYKTNLIAKLPKLFDGMIAYQDTNSGMWYNVVNRDSTLTDGNGNKLETSVTSLMCYALMKAVNEGWVTDSKYVTAGLAAFNGIVSEKLNDANTEISGVYLKSGVGTTDEYYCAEKYETNEAKGIGGVIMAAAEVDKYLGNTETFKVGVVVAPDITVALNNTPDYSDVKITLVGSQGTIKNVDYSDSEVSFVEASTLAVGDTAGTVEVAVVYDDSVIDTFNVNVVDTTVPATGEGTLVITPDETVPVGTNISDSDKLSVTVEGSTSGSGYKYTQFTGDIVSGDEYLIVVVSGSNAYILTNDSEDDETKSAAGLTKTLSSDTIELTAAEATLAEWTFTKQSSSQTLKVSDSESFTATGYQISNAGNSTATYYLRGDGDKIVTRKSATTVYVASDQKDVSANGYEVILRVSSGKWMDLLCSSGTWSREDPTAVDREYVLLFARSENTSTEDVTYEYTVKLDADQTGVLLAKGEKGDVTATLSAVTVTEGAPSATPTGTIKYTSSNTDVATVNETTGEVTAVAAGNAIITASVTAGMSGTDDAVNLSIEIPITVVDSESYAVSLSVTPGAVIATVGDTTTPQLNSTVTVKDLNGTGWYVTYSTGDSNVATVTEYGAVTIVGEGSTTITATVAAITYGGKNYDSDDFGTISATIPVTVNAKTDEEVHTHSYTGSESKAPSCTEAGTMTYTCSCGASYTSEIAATGHNYTSQQTKAPSCTEKGITTYTCSNCGNSYTEEIALADHNYVNGTCSVCGDVVEIEYTYSVLDSDGKALSGQNITLTKGETYTPTFSVSDGTNDVSGSYTMTLEATSNASAVTISGTTITAGEVTSDTVVNITATVTPNNRASASGTSVDFTVTVKAANSEAVTEYYGPFKAVTSVQNNGQYVITSKTYTRTLGYGGTTTNTATWEEADGLYTDTSKVVQLWTFVLANESEGSYYICYKQGNTTYYLVTDSDNYPTVTSTLNDSVTRWTVSLSSNGSPYVNIQAVNSTVERVDLNVQGSGGAKLESVAYDVRLFAPHITTPTYTATITPSSTTMLANTTQTLSASMLLGTETVDGATYTWSVTSGDATISGNGATATLTAGSTGGDVVISVTATSGENTATATATVTVQKYTVSVADATVNEGLSVNLTDSVTVQLNGETITSGYTLVYTVDGATVDSSTYTGEQVDADAEHTIGVSVVVDGATVATGEANLTVYDTSFHDTEMWETKQTDTVALTTGGDLTFTLSGEQPAGFWGFLDNLKLYKADGTEVSITNGDFESGTTGWELTGYSKAESNSSADFNKTNRLNLWISSDAATGEAVFTVTGLEAGEYYFKYDILESTANTLTGTATAVAKNYTVTVADATVSEGKSVNLADSVTVQVNGETITSGYTLLYTVDGIAVDSSTYNAEQVDANTEHTFGVSVVVDDVTVATGEAKLTVYDINFDDTAMWKTLQTNTATVAAGQNLTFTLSAEQPAGYWGFLDNLKLYKADGTEVSITNGDFESGTTGWELTGYSKAESNLNAAYNTTNRLNLWLNSDAAATGEAVFTVTGLDAGDYYFKYDLLESEEGVATGVATSVASSDDRTIVSYELGVTSLTIPESDMASENYVTLDGLKAAIQRANNSDKDTVTLTWTYSDGTTITAELVAGENIPLVVGTNSNGARYVLVSYEDANYSSRIGVTVTEQPRTTSYVLYTGDRSDIKDGDIFLIVSSDQKWALMNDDDGGNSNIAGQSASVTVEGDIAIIGSSDEPYATWTVESWKASEKDAGTVYTLKLSNGSRYIRDSSSTILGSSGKTLSLFTTDTSGLFALAASNTTTDGVLVANGNHWYYDGTKWQRSETPGYVYLYKQVEIVSGVTVEQPDRLYIGAADNNGVFPSVQLAESVLHNGAPVTSGYTETWTVAEGDEDIISVNSSTGEVTAKKGGTATVHLSVTMEDGTVYETDVKVTVVNPAINVTEEMSLINNYEGHNSGTIDATVYGGGAATDSYVLIYESSDNNVATVENGVVTAQGAGTATITTYIKTVNGLDVESLRVCGTTNVTVTEREISNAHLSSYDYIVQQGASDEKLAEALSHMVLTMTWNTGEKITTQYTGGVDADEHGGVLYIELADGITDTLGVKTARVTYTDADGNILFDDTIWIHVEEYNPTDFSGTVLEEYNVSYELDTNGVDVNEEYVIVAKDYAIALKNPDATTTACTGATTAAVEFQNERANITIGSEDAKLSAWLIDTPYTEGSYIRYNASNFLRYLGTDAEKMLIHENVEHIYIENVGNGEYRIILSMKNGQPETYLNYNGTAWETTTTQSSVYLYRKNVSYQDYGVDFSVKPATQTMPEGFTSSITPTVVFNKTETLTSDRYEIIWSSSDESIATVDKNGNVTGIAPGTATITAKLVSVDGFEVVCNIHEVPYIEKTATVTVVDAEIVPILHPSTLTIGVGSLPNLNKVNVELTYPDLSEADQAKYNQVVVHELLTFNMVDATGTITKDGVSETVTGFTSEYPGVFTVQVTYAGQTFPLTINIVDDPYAGRETAESIPGYPDAGAVRMEKTATGVIDFTRTGVVKLELNAAGISTVNAVDVVLIVDVSNSMAWSMDWFNGLSDDELKAAKDPAKIPAINDDNTINGTTKLDMAMSSAKDFASILLTEGSGNTLTFVTFAGNDSDHGGVSDNLDSVRTPFLGVEDYATAESVFNATKFTHLVKKSDTSVSYYLDIGGHSSGDSAVTSGYAVSTNDEGETVYSGKTNRGNTNYDYAFGEATDAITALKAKYEAETGESYDKSGRQLHLVFMTDGAPSAYNGIYLNGKTSDTTWPGTTGPDDKGDGNYTQIEEDSRNTADWLTHINNYHYLATALKDQIYGAYTVGFDLAHGGFGDYSWDESDMERVLAGMAKNSVLPVTMATNETELHNFYRNLAKALAHAGTSAKVTDQIGDDFTLFTGVHMYSSDITDTNQGEEADKQMTSNIFNQMSAMDFNIEILSYRLVLSSDIGNVMDVYSMDGVLQQDVTITKDHLGLRVAEDPQVIETITFSYDEATGTLSAYSSELGDGVNILSTGVQMKSLVPNEDGTYSTETYDVVINAKYFTYTCINGTTVTDPSVENIEWKIGDITDREIAMSYYAYLDGSLDNPKEATDGLYNTNEFAYIQYIDVNGDYVKRDYAVPSAAWGSAGITYRFYLVNEKGEFVNRANVVFDNPANRIILNERISYTTELNNGGGFVKSALDALSDAGLNKYVLFDTSLTTTVTTDVANNKGGVVVAGSVQKGDLVTGTTDQYYVASIQDRVYVNDVMNDGTYVNTIIDIPVVLKDLGNSERPMADKSVVMDYGKEMPIDPFVTEEASYATGYYNYRDGNKYWYTMEIIGFWAYDSEHDMTAYIDGSKVETSLTTENGTYSLGDTVTTEGGRTYVKNIIFTPSRFLEEVDKVFVAVKFAEYTAENGISTNNDMIMYKLVSVIPATTVYYEVENNLVNEFTFSGTHGRVDESGNPVNDTYGNQFIDSDWTKASAAEIGRQDEHGADDVYGADSHYSDFAAFSDNGYVRADGQGVKNTTVTFSFTGTGFDIISKTGANDGTIKVTVTGPETKTITVINKGENELYQIPVVSIKNLTYGTYNVEIGVYNAVTYTGALAALSRGGEFYFDAVRIYDPAKGNVEAESAYVTDNEYQPEYYEVRDQLITAGDTDFTDGEEKGVSYIDKGSTGATMADYKAIGPNNEVYLAPAQTNDDGTVTSSAIAFKISWQGDAPTSIDIGAKSVDSSKSAKLNVWIASNTEKPDAPVVANKTLNTATAQFYELVNGENAATFASNKVVYVFVENNGEGVLSITDIKVAYGSNATVTGVEFFSGDDVLDYANACATFAPTDDDTSTDSNDAVIAQKGRTLDVRDMIYVIDIFELTKVENVDLSKDAGLLVWTVDEYEALNGQITFDAAHACVGLKPYMDTGYYYGASAGIFTRDLHKEAYYVGYVKQADGTYVFSEAKPYSPATYAYNMLAKEETTDVTGNLCVALLNYISAAQQYFHGTAKADQVNVKLSDEQKALNWNVTDLNLAPAVPDEKNVERDTAVFTGVGKTLLLEEMISLVALYKIENSVAENAIESGTIFWTAEQFEALEGVPSVDNIGQGIKFSVTKSKNANQWYSAAPAVAPKDMAESVYYILGYVIHADGTISYSGVTAYTFEQYIHNMADSATVGEFAMRLYYYERAAKAALGAN